jgi:two-component system, NarL family, sensor histidine kinase UhpB
VESIGESTDDARVFVSTLRPERRDRLLALGVVAGSALLFVALAFFAKLQLPRVWAFIPIYESALIISDLLTAALLIGQYNILRTRPLLVLAGGYLFTAFIATAHMLSFPGLFAPGGLLGGGDQTTAWLYMFWHAGFPVAVIGYTLSGRTDAVPRPNANIADRATVPVLSCIVVVLAWVSMLTALVTIGHESMPRILNPQALSTPRFYLPGYFAVIAVVWAVSFAALVILMRRRPHSVLDLWVMVVLCAWFFDIGLASALNRGRFDLGFYVGRIYGLLAATFVLIVLTFENVRLYARVVAALDSERRERRLVQQRTAELNEAKALLEQRVAARTAALAASNRDLLHEVTERKRIEEALRQSQDELRELAAISSSAREQEKRRIARELHDDLAQTLATLRLELDRLGEEVRLVGSVRNRLADMRTLVDDSVTSTRRLAADLRPMMLDDLGLVAAVQWFVQAFRQRYGLDCMLLVDPEDLELEEPYSTTAYRIIQESLTNVARHARASHVRIGLIRQDAQVVLSVRDDGVGFDLSERRKPTSFGLAGLRERAYLVDGKLTIESSPGQGTAIEVRIPLPATQGERAVVIAVPANRP